MVSPRRGLLTTTRRGSGREGACERAHSRPAYVMGITCRECGDTRIRRPISDYYNLADGRLWHVPYFVGMFPCRECRTGRGAEE